VATRIPSCRSVEKRGRVSEQPPPRESGGWSAEAVAVLRRGEKEDSWQRSHAPLTSVPLALPNTRYKRFYPSRLSKQCQMKSRYCELLLTPSFPRKKVSVDNGKEASIGSASVWGILWGLLLVRFGPGLSTVA